MSDDYDRKQDDQNSDWCQTAAACPSCYGLGQLLDVVGNTEHHKCCSCGENFKTE